MNRSPIPISIKRTSRASLLVTVLASVLVVACQDLPESVPAAAGHDGGSEDDPTSNFRQCQGDSLAHQVFNDFWKTFDDRYAVFDIRLSGESWGAIGEEACAQITEPMTDDALFDVLLGMAQHLDDGHITLTADDIGRDEDAEVSIYPNYDAVYGLEDLVEAAWMRPSCAVPTTRSAGDV